MARWYLIIILIGGLVGAMLPSGTPSPSEAAETGARPTLTVKPRGASDSDSYAAASSTEGGNATTLYRGDNGHFYADVMVNGTNVHFLVDTGASAVALSAEDARRVGLSFSSMEFTPVGSGASGEVRGKFVTLDRVSLAGHEVAGVQGVILEGGDTSLLGQSFLAQLGTIEIRGDRMLIR